jgi:hypothetical protein
VGYREVVLDLDRKKKGSSLGLSVVADLAV